MTVRYDGTNRLRASRPTDFHHLSEDNELTYLNQLSSGQRRNDAVICRELAADTMLRPNLNSLYKPRTAAAVSDARMLLSAAVTHRGSRSDGNYDFVDT